MSKEEPKPRYGVICEHYVSLHKSQKAAVDHMRAIARNGCKAAHYVQKTTLPYGTRHRG